MNLLPIELYLYLFGIIPVGLCFAKWRFGLRWRVTAGWCAALSWVYCNLAMLLYPPENGFARFVYLVTGWFWLLPLFLLLAALFHFIGRKMVGDLKVKAGRWGFQACALAAAGILAWSVFGHMSQERAVIEARSELRKRGLEPRGKEIPAWEDGHWIIRYPECEFKEIRLNRNGQFSWIGGPG